MTDSLRAEVERRMHKYASQPTGGLLYVHESIAVDVAVAMLEEQREGIAKMVERHWRTEGPRMTTPDNVRRFRYAPQGEEAKREE